MKNYILTAIIVASYGTVSAQTFGNLDPTFNTTGIAQNDVGPLELYQDVKIQLDGKVIAVGTTYDPNYVASIIVGRLLPDGTYDSSFGTNGVFTYHLNYETGAYDSYLDKDGKLIVAGYTTDNGGGGMAMLLLRLNTDGTLDTSFGVNGVTYYDIGPREDIAYGIAIQNDDKILICGSSVDTTTVNYDFIPVVLRFSPDGAIDTTFGDNGIAKIPVLYNDNEFTTLCIQPNGKIIAAGHIANDLLWFSALIARFNTDGSLDTTYGNNGIVNKNVNNVDDEFFDIQLTTNNQVLLTGFTTTQGDFVYHTLVMKYDSTGSPFNGFGSGGQVVLGTEGMNVGDALAVQPDGKILIAGGSGQAPPDNLNWGLWRLNADGSTDNTFGENGRITTDFYNGVDEALGIALQTDNKIVVAGKSRNDANFNLTVVRYDPSLVYTTGIDNTKANAALTVFPNPANNTLFICGLTKKANVFIYDLVGQLVASSLLTSENGSIDVSALQSGIYVIRIADGTSQKTIKFIKK